MCVYNAAMRASDRAYTALHADIVEGRLSPGTVLGEVEQSERLGVSRTPVREAFSRLTAAGLAVQAPGRGTVVSSISLDDVSHLFELRIPLETQAARLAAQRGEAAVFAGLASRFEELGHRSGAALAGPAAAEYYRLAGELDAAIDQAVTNPYLTSALQSLRVHLVRVRRLARDEPARLAASAREHRAICSAIAASDPDLAEAAAQMHLRQSLNYILSTDTTAAPRTDHTSWKDPVPS